MSTEFLCALTWRKKAFLQIMCSRTVTRWSPVSQNDRGSVSLPLLGRDYPVITFRHSRSQQRSPWPNWVVLHSVWPDGFLFVPTTRMGQKVLWEWGGEVVDEDFRSTSSASTSLAVGELLQLVVQQLSALAVTGLALTTITVETLVAFSEFYDSNTFQTSWECAIFLLPLTSWDYYSSCLAALQKGSQKSHHLNSKILFV